eukprot:PhM_4_TR6774/c0_g1_i1/m.20264
MNENAPTYFTLPKPRSWFILLSALVILFFLVTHDEVTTPSQILATMTTKTIAPTTISPLQQKQKQQQQLTTLQRLQLLHHPLANQTAQLNKIIEDKKRLLAATPSLFDPRPDTSCWTEQDRRQVLESVPVILNVPGDEQKSNWAKPNIITLMSWGPTTLNKKNPLALAKGARLPLSQYITNGLEDLVPGHNMIEIAKKRGNDHDDAGEEDDVVVAYSHAAPSPFERPTIGVEVTKERNVVDVSNSNLHWRGWGTEQRSWPEVVALARRVRAVVPVLKKRGAAVPLSEEVVVPRSLPLIPFQRSIVMFQISRRVPAITAADIVTQLAHVWASGLCAPAEVRRSVLYVTEGDATVMWSNFERGLHIGLVHSILRHMPHTIVPLLPETAYRLPNVVYFATGFMEYYQPVLGEFLYNYLVPRIVRNIRSALKRRKNNTTHPSPAFNSPNRVATPWWSSKYTAVLENPPEKLCFVKSRAHAFTVRRSGEIAFSDCLRDELTKSCGYYNVVSDMPLDLRAYLINHARTVALMWGSTVTTQLVTWGGGFIPNPRRNLDVIIYVDRLYEMEWFVEQFMRQLKAANPGVELRYNHTYGTNTLKVALMPPGLGFFGIQHIWTKFVLFNHYIQPTKWQAKYGCEHWAGVAEHERVVTADLTLVPHRPPTREQSLAQKTKFVKPYDSYW